MHVHPRTNPETVLAATPQLVAPKKTQTAPANAQPVLTGLYAQTLKNGRKSGAGAEDDSGSTEATVATGEPPVNDEQTSIANLGSGIALRTYTAAGAFSKPPSVAGEKFSATV